MSQSNQKAMIAKIKIAQKQLNMDDDIYRAILQRETGKRSTTQMTESELIRVLDEMQRLGFVPSKTYERKPLRRAEHTPMINKISVLLTQTGKSWNYAHGIAKRMFGRDTVQQCDSEQIHKIIAALQYHAQRHAQNS